MSSSFCLTIRFLLPSTHGRGDRGGPEWPPSPLRAFQALVAASAARWNEREDPISAAPALRWLERQPAPTIIAPVAWPSSTSYRLYVPDNVADKVAGTWSRGGTASIADYRSEKDVRPMHLRGESCAVHYLWSALGPDFEDKAGTLRTAARGITHLGWGVDMVVADATVVNDEDQRRLEGIRWVPSDDPGATGLRVPVEGTLPALIVRHRAFLRRLEGESFNPVPPLAAFRVVGYRRASEPARRPFAAFRILRPDAAGFRPFDTVRQGKVVAAMLRHAASRPEVANALGWSEEKVAGFVLGHGEAIGQPHRPVSGPRLAFIPLPTIEARGGGRANVVGSIRRAMIATSDAREADHVSQLARILSGSILVKEGTGETTAMLSEPLQSDLTVGRYCTPATTWATVTPVILPGHDDPRKIRKKLFARTVEGCPHVTTDEQAKLLDKLDRRIDDLLRKAIRQAGYSEELALNAEIEWRSTGFWPGNDHARCYDPPEKLRRFRRLHVRITWRDKTGEAIPIPGPVCLGGGRFVGLGLFAAY